MSPYDYINTKPIKYYYLILTFKIIFHQKKIQDAKDVTGSKSHISVMLISCHNLS